jgi:hypothetical protein
MDNLNEQQVPLRADGTPKVRFEVMMRPAGNGVIEKAVFINGEELDWAIDASSLMEARAMGPKFFRAVQADIIRHYVESVSEVVGRKVTVEDIQNATKTGWI